MVGADGDGAPATAAPDERYRAPVTTSAPSDALAPHTHRAVAQLIQDALAAAAGTGGVAAFRCGPVDDYGRGSWYLDLANGGVHELSYVGTSANGGGGVIGVSEETIVVGPAPARVGLPEVPVTAGRIRTADVEAWVAAVITNAMPVTDGQGWLRTVETETSFNRIRSKESAKYGVYARYYSGGGTFITWRYTVPAGQQPRGEAWVSAVEAV